MWWHNEYSDERLSRRRSSGPLWGGSWSNTFCFALGATAMYFLDPVRGKARQKLLRDKMIGWSNCASDRLRKTAQHAANHAVGFAAETRARLAPDCADDHTISERVRSALGRVASHPKNIEVTVHDGIVTLCGCALRNEVQNIVRTVSRTRGVLGVENQLETGDRREPASQGAPGMNQTASM
jgi:hypothetical protein